MHCKRHLYTTKGHSLRIDRPFLWCCTRVPSGFHPKRREIFAVRMLEKGNIVVGHRPFGPCLISHDAQRPPLRNASSFGLGVDFTGDASPICQEHYDDQRAVVSAKTPRLALFRYSRNMPQSGFLKAVLYVPQGRIRGSFPI